MIEIKVLGTGAADSIKYFHSCFYFEPLKGPGLLVDTGGGYRILDQLKQCQLGLEDISHIFITHVHLDHVTGALWLLRKIGSKIVKGQMDYLNIYAPKRVVDFLLGAMSYTVKGKVYDQVGNRILFHALEDMKDFQVGDMKIVPFDVGSTKEDQFGFSCAINNRKIVFLGDEPLKNLENESFWYADLLFADAYCLTSDSDRFRPAKIHHSTVQQAAETANKIYAQRLVLHHTEEESTIGRRKELYSNDASSYFNGRIFVPDDLDTIILR